jgi:hypothetical protein
MVTRALPDEMRVDRYYARMNTAAQRIGAFVACILVMMLTSDIRAQSSRLHLGGVPTNLHLDWTSAVAVPYTQAPDNFVVLMPLSALAQWAQFEGPFSMNWTYGQNNWLQCSMVAEAWSYLSLTPCAHQAPAGQSTPLSLLTTNFDFGSYSGSPGLPFLPDATLFFSNGQSYMTTSGLGMNNWELRTSDFFGSPWNSCSGGGFGGWLLARFSYSFN